MPTAPITGGTYTGGTGMNTRLGDLGVDNSNSIDPTTGRLIVEVLGGGASGLLGPIRLQDGSGTNLANVNVSGGDGQVSMFSLDTIAQIFAWNGATFDRARTASAANLAAQSGLGALLIGPPGEWDVSSTPAVGAQATASRVAGAAGVRHIARRVSFGFSSSAALAGVTSVTFNLRDGATGAGTILKSWVFALPAAIITPFAINFEVNSIGTAATAMTLETLAAVAGLQVFTNLSGYDAS